MSQHLNIIHVSMASEEMIPVKNLNKLVNGFPTETNSAIFK